MEVSLPFKVDFMAIVKNFALLLEKTVNYYLLTVAYFDFKKKA